ncbi:hypothetical protein [Paraburkholderia domus]|uniref:Uncharacterized protein n=1 Tax=Paraburkholderia domus TaxID=2793075 RepID=A0A9N8MRQ2_9BURK|nr:hypothetical protein [Paraburkholderia domus]MBK5163806.1 hypothetical protein [Burkholderia sp. R-70211]CAE6858359.1 hypothetical protein R70211_00306 [Paraburkholderia domus]
MQNSRTNTVSSPLESALEEAHGLSRRDVFLLEMYKQCSGHLNRHVTAMWQCIAVVVAFGATLRMDADGPSFDYAIAVALLLCTWLAASNLDASAWFNRNIAIITNIERLFLESSDASLVHPFFLPPHRANKVIAHFKIQIWFAGSVGFILLALHFFQRVSAGFALPFRCFDPSRALPYGIGFFSLIALVTLKRYQNRQQEKINLKSPGLQY